MPVLSPAPSSPQPLHPSVPCCPHPSRLSASPRLHSCVPTASLSPSSLHPPSSLHMHPFIPFMPLSPVPIPVASPPPALLPLRPLLSSRVPPLPPGPPSPGTPGTALSERGAGRGDLARPLPLPCRGRESPGKGCSVHLWGSVTVWGPFPGPSIRPGGPASAHTGHCDVPSAWCPQRRGTERVNALPATRKEPRCTAWAELPSGWEPGPDSK